METKLKTNWAEQVRGHVNMEVYGAGSVIVQGPDTEHIHDRSNGFIEGRR